LNKGLLKSTAGDQKPPDMRYGFQVLDNTVTAVKERQNVHTKETALSGKANQRMTKQYNANHAVV
jgi:hypothetical protein